MCYEIIPDMATKNTPIETEAKKRRGRPPGTGLPPELVRNHMIRIRATEAEEQKFEAIGGIEAFRKWLHRSRIK
jgi:hypothetical protein